MFGETIGEPGLTEVFWKLFCNSTAESTKRTYSVSTNHFKRFISSCKILPFVRYIPNQLTQHEMILGFFTAYLYKLPSIRSARTIANYSSQLKAAWEKMELWLAILTNRSIGMLKGCVLVTSRKALFETRLFAPTFTSVRVFATYDIQSTSSKKTNDTSKSI